MSDAVARTSGRSSARAALVSSLAPVACGRRAAAPRDGGAAEVGEASASPVATSAAATAAGFDRTQRVVVDEIALELADGADLADEVRRQLARDLGRLLTGTGWFSATVGQVPAGRIARHARVHLTLRAEQTPQPPQLTVGLEARVAWRDHRDDPAPAVSLLTGQPVAKAGQPMGKGDKVRLAALIAELAGALILRAAPELATKEEIRLGDEAHVLAALSSDDPDVVDWALTIGGERRLAGLRTRAAELLMTPPPVRDAAVGYLVALGDPAAVAPLTRAARFDDPAFLHTVIEAVSALGGDEAREFLEFVASGHDDDEMGEHARAGLERLRRGE